MTRILFLGDTHGNLDFLRKGMVQAVSMNCDALFQVGDFGFLWPGSDQLKQVKLLSASYDLPVLWIDGNHDWHPEIRQRFLPYYVERGTTRFISDNTLRYSTIAVCGLGGAPSIDKSLRRPGKSWWPEEEITQEEVDRVGPGVDIFVSHDAPKYPPGFGRTGNADFDARSEASMRKVNQGWERSEASLLVHGHWHKGYREKYKTKRVIGLDCDFGRFQDTFVVVEKTSSGLLEVL